MDRIDQLERRLASLAVDCNRAQRSARRARTLALGACALLVGSLLVAGAAPGAVKGVMKLKRLEIVDTDGQLVFAVASDARGGRMDLWSASGANVMRAGVNEHGGDLNVWNDDGATVYAAYATDGGGALGVWNADSGQAAVYAHATDQGGQLEVRNDIGMTVLDLAAGATRSGRLTVAGADAAPRFTVDALDEDETNVAVLDGTGRERFRAVARIDGGMLSLHDDAGHPAITANATGAAGRLAVRNHAGHPIFDVRTDAAGNGALAIGDAAGVDRVRVDAGSGSVSVRDDAGVALVSIDGASKAGAQRAGRIVVHDRAGLDRLELGAGALVLRDESGATLMEAGDNETTGGGRLALHGPTGGERLRLGAGTMAVRNDIGATVVEVGSSTTGGFVDVSTPGSRVATLRADTDGGGRLDLSNGAGERVFSADVIDDGAALALRTAKGRHGLLMAARADGALMNLFNRREVPVIAIDAQDGPGGAISILNQRGTPVVLLEADTEDRGIVRVYDADQVQSRSLAAAAGRTPRLARE